MNRSSFLGVLAVFAVALVLQFESMVITGSCAPESDENKSLGGVDITSSWNLSFLFEDRDAASSELERLRLEPGRINVTYRPMFDRLSGPVLLSYIEEEKNLSKSLDVLYSYAYAEKSLNVNDRFYEVLVSDVQNLSTDAVKATSFADVKLKSLTRSEWDRLFNEEPGLEKYRPHLEHSYIRYTDHRPMNETHAAYIADIGNELMKLETQADKKITNNVTVSGNITLKDGSEVEINSQSYYDLMFTDADRDNRKACYERRFHHLANESDAMAELYLKKCRLDDLSARELNYTDAYDARMFDDFLKADQIDVMNAVFKERKGVYDGYYELRREKMGLQQLMPYDMFLQLMKDPGKKYSYEEALAEINGSYAGMSPEFKEIFQKTITGGFMDVYPNPDGGKQPGGYCQPLYALKLPALIFLNYKGTIDDKSTITHEMGHAINSYLMGKSVDYLYCGGPMYEMEVPSSFDEELMLDFAIQNYDRDTAIAVLADQIRSYENSFTFQCQITEFERRAHQLCDENENVSGSDLNALWTDIAKDYRTEKIAWYDPDEAKWTYVSHIYFTNNYYTFSYALSEAITLSLFKMYKEDPETFNENYVAYISAGTTLTPPEKLEKYFGIEIDRKLFEDAMDIVEMRVKQLEELEKRDS